MSLSLEVLQEKNKVLLELYRDHLQTIQELQRKLQNEKRKEKEISYDSWLDDTGKFGHFGGI